VGIIFTGMFGLPNNAYATCVNTIQSQAIAAAYEGDQVPTVHTMDTCGGDDVSYQIPIATTITFDGVQYSNIYATTNSVITFGNQDNTYWDYPSTPSISLYSMDWVSGWYNASDTLNISYSEGGFQLDLEVIPFGQWNTPTPSNINIIVAITNTGGISVAYSYQGPEYPNLRTGVRLHNGQIVSLEAWGATQVSPSSNLTLSSEPISGSITNPTVPITPEQQQAQVAQSQQLATEISSLNNLIANINNDPEPEVTPDPEPTETPVDPDPIDPDVIVDPEIVTPEDPRFPDNTDEQNSQDDSNQNTDSETTPVTDENSEPSSEPSSQPEDTNQDQTDQPSVNPDQNFDKNPLDNTSISDAISEEDLKKLNAVISINDAKLLAKLFDTNENIKQAVVEFAARAEENKDAPMPYTVADAIAEVQAEKLLSDPVGTLTAVFSDIDLQTLTSPTEWGKDMTDDQREKIQEIVVPVIIASNIVAASMTRRK
jgi:hypothetical protein